MATSVSDLVAAGKTREAIDLLLQTIPERDTRRRDQATLLSARYADWLEEERMGTTSDPGEINRIHLALLELAQGPLPAPIPVPVRSGAPAWRKWALPLLFLSLVGGTIIWFFTKNPSNSLDGAGMATVQYEPAAFSLTVGPMGVICNLTLETMTLQPKDDDEYWLDVTLTARNTNTGWAPAQFTSSLFLLEADGLSTQTITDLILWEIGPGETKRNSLRFALPHGIREATLLVRQFEGEPVRVALAFSKPS